MANLCIIPARGGSKRIPRKNIKDFLGKPIIAYSIEVALQSGLFDEVMVSTDDVEIANIASIFGASVPFMRSIENSTDYATTMSVIEEVIKNYKEKKEVEYQYVCCIYPTAPLIRNNDLHEGIKKIIKNNFTCVFPIVNFGYPVWRGLEITDHGKINMIWPEMANSRSQDLKKVYHDAGQWYWFNTDHLNCWVWPNNTGSIILSEEIVQDIDSITDWKLAEIKFKLLNQNNI
jgi:pseudaminic acid cytidylyltransferase